MADLVVCHICPGQMHPAILGGLPVTYCLKCGKCFGIFAANWWGRLWGRVVILPIDTPWWKGFLAWAHDVVFG